MKAWRENRRVDARRGEAPADLPTFAEDVARYLETIPTMPTFAEREMQVEWWVARFGGRVRQTITSQEIRRELELLRASGKAASTCNHYRTALSHVWRVLDGKSAWNPVRDVPKFDEGDPEPRALPTDLVDAIFATIRPGKTRARLAVIRWIGLPHAQLRQIQPEHVNWTTRELYVTRRRKGKGARARVLPLLPQAVSALRDMKTHDAWGDFSMRSMRVTLARALDKLRKTSATRPQHVRKLSALARAWLARETRFTRVRPYDLRHTFGTMLALHTPDRKARQELMLHSDSRQTDRYEMAAADPAVRKALRLVSAAVGERSGRNPASTLPRRRSGL